MVVALDCALLTLEVVIFPLVTTILVVTTVLLHASNYLELKGKTFGQFPSLLLKNWYMWDAIIFNERQHIQIVL